MCEVSVSDKVNFVQGNILLSIGTPKGLIVAADLFVVWPITSAQAQTWDLLKDFEESPEGAPMPAALLLLVADILKRMVGRHIGGPWDVKHV